MAELLVDVSFPRITTVELRLLGHDVMSLEEDVAGGRYCSDVEVRQTARLTKRILLTLDGRSFARFAPTEDDHPGIIVCDFDPDFVGQAHRIDAMLAARDRLDGQIVRVGRGARRRPDRVR